MIGFFSSVQFLSTKMLSTKMLSTKMLLTELLSTKLVSTVILAFYLALRDNDFMNQSAGTVLLTKSPYFIAENC